MYFITEFFRIKVNQHSGDITIEDKSSASTTFTVNSVSDSNKEIVVKATFKKTPGGDDNDDVEDDDDSHNETHKTASWVLNPNEKQQLVATGQVILGGYKAGYQKQGEIAKAVFKASTPAGWTEAFAFNLIKDGKPDFTQKSGTFTLYIPSEYQKAGRQFALLWKSKRNFCLSLNCIR